MRQWCIRPLVCFSCQRPFPANPIGHPRHPSENPILQATAKASSTSGSTSHFCDRTEALLLASAHPVVTHSCRPAAGRRTIYSSPGVAPNQSVGADRLSRHDPRRVAHLRNACASHVIFGLGRFPPLLFVPATKSLPTDFRQFPRGRHPSDLGAGTFANPRVEVSQRDVVADHVHGHLNQDPTKPGGTFMRNRPAAGWPVTGRRVCRSSPGVVSWPADEADGPRARCRAD